MWALVWKHCVTFRVLKLEAEDLMEAPHQENAWGCTGELRRLAEMRWRVAQATRRVGKALKAVAQKLRASKFTKQTLSHETDRSSYSYQGAHNDKLLLCFPGRHI